MSVYSRIKASEPIQPIAKEGTPFYKSNTNKGSECLRFNDEEIYDEGGHTITFYPNGALLSLKETCKYYPTSKSFVFFNNNGEKILEIYNSIKSRNPQTLRTEFLPPEKDIEITIYNGFVMVTETNLRDLTQNEYFVSVKDGTKILDIGAETDNQLSMN